jgi:DNA (cytosine-5)-methyltransferase 1
MKVLSLFSGVGGFDLGLERAGMETVFQCEWDKHATKILERHWPDVPRWDDVSTLTGKHILAHAPVIDIVAWGSPCQDLSVAGKRAGLDGSRSGLFHEGIRIIKELRKETNNVYPRISLWENVYGALNSNKGADFGVILDEMAEAGSLVQEWRVLDAQYFGVPQRRRRVFLVSVFDTATAARCPDPLLPVSESVRGDTPTSGTPRQEPTGTATQSFGNSGFQQWRETDTAVTLSTRDHKGSMTLAVEQTRLLGSEIVGSLNAVDYKWPQNQQLDENKFVAVETFTKAKRAQTTTDDETWVEGKPAPTLNSFDQGDTRATTVVVGDSIVFDDDRRVGPRIFEQTIGTLQAFMGTGGNNTPMVAQAIPIQDGRDMEHHQNGLGIGEEGAPSYTLMTTGGQAVAYAFDSLSSNSMKSSNPNSGVRVTEIAKTLDTARPDPSCNQGGIAITQPVTYGIQGNVIGRQDHNGPAGKGYTDEGDPMFTLTGTDIHAVASTMAVRRLTPVECERLMGWPDGWTEGQADTHRYKQCGNGVASPVATWIAQQLLQLDKEPDAPPTTTT